MPLHLVHLLNQRTDLIFQIKDALILQQISVRLYDLLT